MIKTKVMEMIESLLGNNIDSYSSQRFVFLFSCIISNVAIFGTWLGFSIYNGTLMNIPDGVLLLYLSANGISMTGKVIQKNLETKKPEKIEEVKNGSTM